MALWRSNLRVSHLAQVFSLLMHAFVVVALITAAWPVCATLVWMLLFILTVLESVRSQRRIFRRCGEVVLFAGRQLQWQQRRWQIVGRPWISGRAILLVLQARQGEKHLLWLMSDSMNQAAWRQVRQLLLSPSFTYS